MSSHRLVCRILSMCCLGMRSSVSVCMQHYLDGAGRWGAMEAPRWERFVDWLAERGLLTSAMPSRSPVEGVSASLDDLRRGRAGAPVPRDAVSMEALFTNAFLPS